MVLCVVFLEIGTCFCYLKRHFSVSTVEHGISHVPHGRRVPVLRPGLLSRPTEWHRTLSFVDTAMSCRVAAMCTMTYPHPGMTMRLSLTSNRSESRSSVRALCGSPKSQNWTTQIPSKEMDVMLYESIPCRAQSPLPIFFPRKHIPLPCLG